MGFGKGETSLKDLIRTIDIALGDKEGRLSRNKLAIIRRILEACATTVVTMGEVVEVGAAVMTIIPTAEPCPCKLLARVKSIKSNNVRL